MSPPVLPVARDDGYYLVDHGSITFVPIERPKSLADLAAEIPEKFFVEGGKAKVIHLAERLARGKS